MARVGRRLNEGGARYRRRVAGRVGGRGGASLLAALLPIVAAGCSGGGVGSVAGSVAPDTTAVAATNPAPASTVRSTTTAPVPASTTTTSSSTTVPASTSSTTTSSTTTSVVPVTSVVPETAGLDAAFERLAVGVDAASMTVLVGGSTAFRRASGTTVDGADMTADSPMVVASVSKLVTALSVARLAQRGALSVDDPVPWAAMGLSPAAGWETVTIRDLLDHTSGMPVARRSWLDDPGSCAVPLQSAIAAPPTSARGEWRYSNGNYCALGLVVEHVTGSRLDVAADQLVFVPAGVVGPHLTLDGNRPGDAPYRRGIARFDRLGGAGTWMASSDDMAAVLVGVTDEDRETLVWPGVFVDQYGWGHTGTVDGAGACAWMLDEVDAVVVAAVSGDAVRSGGAVCDLVLPAVAVALGGASRGDPVRSPE